MAKRIPITIDAETQQVDPQSPLSKLVPSGVRSVVTHGGRIIPASDFGRYRAHDIAEGFDTQHATINKASHSASDVWSLKTCEAALVNRWLQGFEPCRLGARDAFVSSTGELLAVKNFPLPDHFDPDHINLIIKIPHYPTVPPLGIYLAETSQTPRIISRIKSRVNVFRGAAYHDAEAPRPGYQWVCLIASDWRIDWSDIRKGANLQKYLSHFYAVLSE
jgi:hypothetical protein